MHKWIANILGIVLIIYISVISINQMYRVNAPMQTMSVSATGKASMTPDVAVVMLGVISEGASPIEVQNSNNQKINQIIAFIKAQNINASDIQTSTFYASPKYNYTNGQSTIMGYSANQTLTVKVRNIDKSNKTLEKIVQGSVAAGANQIQNVSFSFSDTDKLQQTATKQAIIKAKQKAQQLAADAGIKLGRVVNIIEAFTPSVGPIPLAAMARFAKMPASTPTIEPGTQEVEETITLIFEVK